MNLSPKAKETKTNINKLDLIKVKSFYRAKETIDKTKRKPTKLEKIFANDMTDEGLISKLYKQLIQLNIKNKQANKQKNPKQPNLKLGRRPE